MNNSLCLKGNRAVRHTDCSTISSTPRLDSWFQVFVWNGGEWGGRGGMFVSYTVRPCVRKEEIRSLDLLTINPGNWTALPPVTHNNNNKHTEVAEPPSCSRIGVYVHHSAGILSVYDISDPHPESRPRSLSLSILYSLHWIISYVVCVLTSLYKDFHVLL